MWEVWWVPPHPPGIVHSLCLSYEGHETRRQTCLLLKESRFVTTMFEKWLKNNPIFSEWWLGEAVLEAGGYPSLVWELRTLKPRRAAGCIWNWEKASSLQFCEVLGNFTSVSDHLIFPAVSVHRQGSYIISARRLCSQDSKSCIFSL